MGGSSGGVAVLLESYNPHSRLDQLEDTFVDNVVLTVRLGRSKLVVNTSNVRADDLEGLR